ncbi:MULTISPECIES: fused MFS/spermidine synthase [Deefgea]|uniref:Transferase n=1 Tax=Deefgea chitinilytica TaxID=570276 RepID=A0ABS2CC34_9NEIS|nr:MULTISPECIES: fused MFS/spermidine synthase [Deefgea]MBM5570906.1 transferase [Deefgea chitinilytica]MBM9888135.1 fused MFS/spermidine synthase [Deefgea sp. CFH1-16]
MTSTETPSSSSFADLFAETLSGKPFVYEEGDEVSLMFDLTTVQSRMNRSAPNDLLLGYTRSMLAFELLHSNTQHIGMIGLGGGSLAKYCYHYLPKATIHVAEIDAGVLALRDRFAIPANDARLNIECIDGALWLKQQLKQSQQPMDALLVDAYGKEGMPDSLATAQFFDDCRAALTPNGVLVVNLWGSDARFDSYYQRIRTVFDDAAIAIGADGCANRLVLAVNSRNFPPAIRPIMNRAQQIAASHSVDMPALARRIERALRNPDGLEPANRHISGRG